MNNQTKVKSTHNEWLNSEEHKSEVANKMKLFQLAVEDGALDHLNGHMPMISQLQCKLHRVVDAAMEMQPQTEEEGQYQSVISMVYTLVEDGRLSELFKAIKERFPEYYIA
jgi:hypothetical protein